MPLVRISLLNGKSAQHKKKIGDVVHQAMVDTIGVPLQDRFQLFSEHSKDDFSYAPIYLDIPHTDDLVFVQICLNEGRTLDKKKALYDAIAKGIARETGIKTADVVINLIEVKKENWSFGDGIAQYA